MALTFPWSTFSLLSVTMCLRNGMLVAFSTDFFWLSLIPLSLHFWSRASSLRSWSFSACSLVSPTPNKIMSSATHSIPSRPSKACYSFFWNISADAFRPKGSLFHLYLQNGVFIVVRICNVFHDRQSVYFPLQGFVERSWVNTKPQFTLVFLLNNKQSATTWGWFLNLYQDVLVNKFIPSLTLCFIAADTRLALHCVGVTSSLVTNLTVQGSYWNSLRCLQDQQHRPGWTSHNVQLRMSSVVRLDRPGVVPSPP